MSAATKYEATAKDLIYHLKFGRASAAANDIAQILNERIKLSPQALIVPIPTAPKRVRMRGYDQSFLIARSWARLREQAYAPLLIRLGQQRQVGQTRSMRQQQMKLAFRIANLPVPTKTPIMLIDDVLTTGSSIDAAAAELRKAGFCHISAAVFAVA